MLLLPGRRSINNWAIWITMADIRGSPVSTAPAHADQARGRGKVWRQASLFLFSPAVGRNRLRRRSRRRRYFRECLLPTAVRIEKHLNIVGLPAESRKESDARWMGLLFTIEPDQRSRRVMTQDQRLLR